MGRQEDEGADEEDEEKKEEEAEVEEEEKAGVEETRKGSRAPRRRKTSLVRGLGRRGRETYNSAWLPSRMSDGGHAV